MMGVDEYTEEEKLGMRDISGPTSEEIFNAYAGESFEQGTTSSIFRKLEMDKLSKQGPKIPVEDLNQKYPELKGKFDKDMTEAEAGYIQERHNISNKRKLITDRAQGLFNGKVLPFAASAIGAMADPIDLAVGMAVGAGIGTVAKGAGVALKGATAFGVDVFGNMLGNATTEVFNYNQTKRELKDYTAEQAFNSVVVSSVASTTISTALGAMFKKLGRLDSRQMDGVNELAQTAIDEGKSVNAVLSKVDTHLDEDFKIDLPTKSALDITEFKDAEVKSLLQASKDLPELRENLKSLSESGKISESELSMLSTNMKDAGVDPTKSYIMDGESQITFDAKRASEIADTLNDPKNDINYHPKIDETLSAPDIIEPKLEQKITELDDRIKEYDTAFKNSGRENLLKEADLHVAKDSRYMEFMDFMANCVGSGVVGG